MNLIEQSRLPDLDVKLDAARTKTWAAVEAIAAQITPGMTEAQGVEIAQKTLVAMGCKKFWHKCHVRFGQGTTLSWDDPYANHVLKADDLFYVDIGPVWDGIEGDAGATFVTGQNQLYKQCQADVRSLFTAVKDRWLTTGATGAELYAYAAAEAEKLGWLLAPSYVRGHRLAEFPHSFHSELPLDQTEFKPAAKRWMLELHICHPKMEFGAFFEDLLA